MAMIIQPFIPGLWRKWLTVTGTSQNIALPPLQGDEGILVTNMGNGDIALEFVDTGGGAALATGDAAGIVILARSSVAISPPPSALGFLAVILVSGPTSIVQLVEGRGV